MFWFYAITVAIQSQPRAARRGVVSKLIFWDYRRRSVRVGHGHVDEFTAAAGRARDRDRFGGVDRHARPGGAAELDGGARDEPGAGDRHGRAARVWPVVRADPGDRWN